MPLHIPHHWGCWNRLRTTFMGANNVQILPFTTTIYDYFPFPFPKLLIPNFPIQPATCFFSKLHSPQQNELGFGFMQPWTPKFLSCPTVVLPWQYRCSLSVQTLFINKNELYLIRKGEHSLQHPITTTDSGGKIIWLYWCNNWKSKFSLLWFQSLFFNKWCSSCQIISETQILVSRPYYL